MTSLNSSMNRQGSLVPQRDGDVGRIASQSWLTVDKGPCLIIQCDPRIELLQFAVAVAVTAH